LFSSNQLCQNVHYPTAIKQQRRNFWLIFALLLCAHYRDDVAHHLDFGQIVPRGTFAKQASKAANCLGKLSHCIGRVSRLEASGVCLPLVLLEGVVVWEKLQNRLQTFCLLSDCPLLGSWKLRGRTPDSKLKVKWQHA
jgi:hypothetical protein